MFDFFKNFNKERKDKPWYPYDYCNPASRALQKVLLKNGIKTEVGFTYESPWVWHTFLKDKD
jgi:hypothetical protein